MPPHEKLKCKLRAPGTDKDRGMDKNNTICPKNSRKIYQEYPFNDISVVSGECYSNIMIKALRNYEKNSAPKCIHYHPTFTEKQNLYIK